MRYLRWLPLASLLVGACASSNTGSCDEEQCPADGGPDGGGAIIDAAPWPVDVIWPDAPDLRGFGEPCTDRTQCESNICIFTGTVGVCSQLCFDGSMCPEGWGCYGVEGVVEPGVVTDVCVPENDQLCQPCVDHSQCSTVFPDLCLAQATGSFCARDCSTIECPTGYTCTTVNVDGSDWRQCLPDSTACDCNASNMGALVGCSIATPFGFCGGMRTCLGDTGWSPCQPPSPTDSPDATFTDDNCDGIDGDIDEGIFVATTGANSGTCGLVHTDPCLTISHGITRAVAAGRANVYIQAGVYAEIVVLANGVSLWGGFDTMWQRDTRSAPGHEVRITGGLDSTIDHHLGIRAQSLSSATTVGDLVIDAPDATGTIGGNGRSTYGIYARDASALTVVRVTILAGNGADGADGSDGTDATTGIAATPGMNGADGDPAHEETFSCNITDHGFGGSGGTNSCGGGLDPTAGTGGNGGEMDTSCMWPGVCDNCNATSGDTGGHAAQNAVGMYGRGGAGGPGGNSCIPDGRGGDGLNGRVQNGPAGNGGPANGHIVNNVWTGRAGTPGMPGQNGGGGGGGGGSGGCDLGIDSWGAGGGGGGAGGCAAVSGGGAGGGGGGSFGIFAIASTVTATDCAITRGTGGGGGDGGDGGAGQSGGVRGFGGSASGDSAQGGNGGFGGHGGHGGGGGGGAGGISFGIYSYASTITQTCTFVGGAAGTLGAGGQSALSAPVTERDGNAGANGASGAVGDVGACAAPGGC